jgi:hypothetical protein
MKKQDLQALINECLAEILAEGYSEFQRVDKGSKGVAAKDKAEEDTYGAGYAAGEKAAKAKYKKLAEAYKQLKETMLSYGSDFDNPFDDFQAEKDFYARAEKMYNQGAELFKAGRKKEAEFLRRKALQLADYWGNEELPPYELAETKINEISPDMVDATFSSILAAAGITGAGIAAGGKLVGKLIDAMEAGKLGEKGKKIAQDIKDLNK